MFVLQPELLESSVEKKLKEFDKFLTELGGKTSVRETWGKQKLAYRIKLFKEGIYVVYNSALPGSAVSEVNNHLRIDTDVIRHLIIKLPEGYAYSKFDEPLPEDKTEKKRGDMRGDMRPAQHATWKADRPAIKKAEPVQEKTAAPEKKTERMKKGDLDEKLDKILGGDDLNI
jgi:small subunit ribosomal protein S6